MLYYATADKSRLVAEGDPEAKWVINSDSPGEFAGLLKAKQEAEAVPAEASPEPTATKDRPKK